MPEYYHIYTERDVLEYFQDKDYPEYKPERYLLLHPMIIEDELKKVDKHSMIYTGEYPAFEENDLFFISESPIKHGIVRYTCTHDILKLIPKEVIFPVGGLTGRYYIKLGDIDDRTGRRFYDVYDRRFNRCVIEGIPIDKFYYLDNDYAVLDNFIIMRGGIIRRGRFDRYSFDKDKNSLIIRNADDPRQFDLYNSCGDLLQVSYLQSELDKTIKELPDIMPLQLPTQVNVQMFRSMIVEQLRKCKVIPGCETDDLRGIASYLHEKGLDLVVDLDTLRVRQVDFAKYFRKCGIADDTSVSPGPRHIMRPVSQNDNNKKC